MSEVILYDYWRSSACYRVRIVLNLKGVAYRAQMVDLTEGDQLADDYLEVNPQALIPSLEMPRPSGAPGRRGSLFGSPTDHHNCNCSGARTMR